MLEPLSEAEWKELVAKRRQALSDYNAAMDAARWPLIELPEKPFKAPKANRLRDAAIAVESEYFERLPYVNMSCCPFDGKPLVRSFDPFGLEGPWWRADATPDEPPACPHFCVLLGAVNFADKPPKAGEFDAHPGPEAPYVVPRLFELPNMVAVVAELPMHNGYTAYPIAYFAERRPRPQDLTAGWRRTNFVYTTQLGVSGWRAPIEEWDFDLLPWVKAGKIRWCEKDSDNSALSVEPSDCFPYLYLPGERARMIVVGDQRVRRGPVHLPQAA